jgi:nucleoside-diphosphate-sugar epimerase
VNVLLTGASGFIGSNLINCASHINFKTVTRSRSFKEDINENEFVIKNLDAYIDWDGALKDIDVVMHLAGVAHNKAKNDMEFEEVNNRATINLAKQAVKAGVKRFIFVSSIGVNGSNTYGKPFSECDDARPYNSFLRSKYNAEKGLRALSKESGMEMVIVRPPLVYGVGAPGNFASLIRLVSKMSLLPFNRLRNKRSFVSITNLVDFLVVCISHTKAAGETFLISDGEDVSTKEFTDLIASGLGKKIYQFSSPRWLLIAVAKLFGQVNIVNQLFGDLEIDSTKANRLLGWSSSETMAQAMAKLGE